MDESKISSNMHSPADRLISLIMELSEEQQESLLEELESRFANERRKHERKPLRAPVDYAVKDSVYRDFIENISEGGIFIQSSRELPVGQKIIMIFSIQGYEKQIKMKGRIARVDDSGIGIKFEGDNPFEELSLRALLNGDIE